MSNGAWRLAIACTTAALLIAGLYADYLIITEYYGDGPPYYGRTVNMDKWRDPMPFLALANIILVIVVGIGLKYTKKLRYDQAN